MILKMEAVIMFLLMYNEPALVPYKAISTIKNKLFAGGGRHAVAAAAVREHCPPLGCGQSPH